MKEVTVSDLRPGDLFHFRGPYLKKSSLLKFRLLLSIEDYDVSPNSDEPPYPGEYKVIIFLLDDCYHRHTYRAGQPVNLVFSFENSLPTPSNE